MLAFLFVAQANLSEISRKIASSFPASAPVLAPLKEVLPAQVGDAKRGQQAYYGAKLLSSVLAKKTPHYVACGVDEAIVARYDEEHVLIARGKEETTAACVFKADTQDDADEACGELTIKVRKGVATALIGRDYVKVRGREDSAGGGAQAKAIACALAKALTPAPW